MAYCSNCGNFLEEGSNFCDQCGKAVKQTQGNTSYQNSTSVPPKKASISDAVVAMVFSILALELSICCFFPVVCIPFIGLSIAFICFSKTKRNRYLECAVEENGFTKAANICSTIAIPLTAFFGFIGFMLTITF